MRLHFLLKNAFKNTINTHEIIKQVALMSLLRNYNQLTISTTQNTIIKNINDIVIRRFEIRTQQQRHNIIPFTIKQVKTE